MARYCGEETAESKIEAAEDFRNRCLLEGKSLISSEDVWTAECVEELNTYFIGNLEAGEGDFFSKLETQLNLASSNAKQLFAEMFWFMLLCPSNIGVASKLESIGKAFSLSGRKIDNLCSASDREKYLSEEVLSGIGSAGVAFNTNRWREFVYFIRFAALFLVLPLDERRGLLSDHQQFSKWLERIPENETRQLRHMMLYLFFPDVQERIFGGTDRKSILVKFTDITSAQYNKLSAREVDERLYSLRLSLELEYQTKELDYYLQPLASRWKDSPVTAWFVNAVSSDDYEDIHDRFCSEGIWVDCGKKAYTNGPRQTRISGVMMMVIMPEKSIWLVMKEVSGKMVKCAKNTTFIREGKSKS